MLRRKLILKFMVGMNDKGKAIYKKVTLKVRATLSDDQLREFVGMYCSMTNNVLVETIVVDERILEVTNNNASIPEEIVEGNLQKDTSDILETGHEVISEEENKFISQNEPKSTSSQKTEMIPSKEDVTALQGNEVDISIKEMKTITLNGNKIDLVKNMNRDSFDEGSDIEEEDMSIFLIDDSLAENERALKEWNPEELGVGNCVSKRKLEPVTFKGDDKFQKDFIKPVEKKKMRPPLEKSLKSSKKKRRKIR